MPTARVNVGYFVLINNILMGKSSSENKDMKDILQNQWCMLSSKL